MSKQWYRTGNFTKIRRSTPCYLSAGRKSKKHEYGQFNIFYQKFLLSNHPNRKFIAAGVSEVETVTSRERKNRNGDNPACFFDFVLRGFKIVRAQNHKRASFRRLTLGRSVHSPVNARALKRRICWAIINKTPTKCCIVKRFAPR